MGKSWFTRGGDRRFKFLVSFCMAVSEKALSGTAGGIGSSGRRDVRLYGLREFRAGCDGENKEISCTK